MLAQWDAENHEAWAQVLGLVPVPLFGPQRARPEWIGQTTVLLDGARSSLNLCTLAEHGGAPDIDSVLSWSWSSDLRHTVVLDQRRRQVGFRRWDQPSTVLTRPFPRNGAIAQGFLEELEREPDPAATTVIMHVLRLFRQIRSLITRDDAFAAVTVFNCMLSLTEDARENPDREDAFLACRKIRDVVLHAEALGQGLVEDAHLQNADLDTDIGDLPQEFVSPEPLTGLRLDADLLLRHAAGQLYQEAHLVIEREARQLRFAGMPDVDRAPRGSLRRDVRLTPVSLARSLTQQALALVDLANIEQITILDPACGSGIFLQEALRELHRVGYRGRVALRGFDVSRVSKAIAEFCLSRTVAEAGHAGMRVDLEIEERDALSSAWGEPTVILMNPPFTAWDDMADDDRRIVSGVLEGMRYRKPDKSMAFVARTMSSLGDGGATSFILPAAMLDNASAQAWRERLTRRMCIQMVGRFRGYGYFRASMVEPAFVVANIEELGRRSPGVRMLLAESGSEDRALRALRLPTGAYGMKGYSLFTVPREQLTPVSWSFRSGAQQRMLDMLHVGDLKTVEDLFVVRQGIRSGLKDAFVLSQQQLEQLPPREQRYFRKVAGTSTIRHGRLFLERSLFYPYGDDPPPLRTEDEVAASVPIYYRDYLLPNRPALSGRAGIDPDKWWLLTWPRAWQLEVRPKLVTKAFGRSGGFAYDEVGDYAVVQGFAWFWRRKSPRFEDALFPWSYLAVLNSRIFEVLLAMFCPRVQGGQFELSVKYVKPVPLPDLADDRRVPPDLLEALAHLGWQLHCGEADSTDEIDALVARLFGVTDEDLDTLYLA